MYVAGYYLSAPLVVYDSSGFNVKTLPNSGNVGAYLIKYATNGTFLWAARQDGSNDDEAYALSTDSSGNVYVSGYYSSSPLVIYDASGVNVKSLVNSGSYGAYVVKYLSSGSFSSISTTVARTTTSAYVTGTTTNTLSQMPVISVVTVIAAT